MTDGDVLRIATALLELARLLQSATPRHAQINALIARRAEEGGDLTEADLADLEVRAVAAVRGAP